MFAFKHRAEDFRTPETPTLDTRRSRRSTISAHR
jgi:hypothetical protein